MAVAENRHGQSDGQTLSEMRQSTATGRSHDHGRGRGHSDGQGSQNRKMVAETVKKQQKPLKSNQNPLQLLWP